MECCAQFCACTKHRTDTHNATLCHQVPDTDGHAGQDGGSRRGTTSCCWRPERAIVSSSARLCEAVVWPVRVCVYAAGLGRHKGAPLETASLTVPGQTGRVAVRPSLCSDKVNIYLIACDEKRLVHTCACAPRRS